MAQFEYKKTTYLLYFDHFYKRVMYKLPSLQVNFRVSNEACIMDTWVPLYVECGIIMGNSLTTLSAANTYVEEQKDNYYLRKTTR